MEGEVHAAYIQWIPSKSREIDWLLVSVRHVYPFQDSVSLLPREQRAAIPSVLLQDYALHGLSCEGSWGRQLPSWYPVCILP